MKLGRRQFLKLAGATGALAAIQGGRWLQEEPAVAELPKAASDLPSILVIVVDTLRADHLSSYGYARSTSPNVDRLAQQGTLFENAFASSSWTQPSHASLVTGRYPYEHGADASKPLDDRYPTIAEALAARGYRTGGFSANYWIFNRRLGFGRGFHHFEDYYRSIKDTLTGTLYGSVFERDVLHRVFGLEYRIARKQAADVNRALLHWIDRDQSRPFFAFLNYYDAHAPYIAPQPYRSQFSQLESPGGSINTDWDMDHTYLPLTLEQVQGEIDAYDGAIAYIDAQIGQLLDELRERDLENTLVVITSDHGELFGEHGLFEHTNSLYRQVIHVPLIFCWPSHVPEGVHVAQPVTNAALPATLLALLGESEQMLFPGPSLDELWMNAELGREWPNPLAEIAQIPWAPDQHLPAHGPMKAVVSPHWHYVIHQVFGQELYDWQNDPEESTDLSEDPEYQPVANEFNAYLETLMPGLAAWPK